ncbi:MAG TPA: hypothetical protein ENH59_00190 [Bacteroidetes bacterium]|nr:hypothetical protein [Bacteroidota bacterium]
MRPRTVLIWITIFSIAMAFLESSVVVYLREIMYPEGFSFPLSTFEGHLALTEILREVSTLLMLASVAFIAGRAFSRSLAWFVYSFAIWDIFYYAFLKLLIDWPSSFLDWDILFLLPVTWTGPVLSPLLVCVLMISLAGVILYYSYRGVYTRLKASEWLILIAGALVVVVSFTWDYSGYILERYSLSDIWNMPLDGSLLEYAAGYIPRSFNWWLFGAGNLVVVSAIILIYRRFRLKS